MKDRSGSHVCHRTAGLFACPANARAGFHLLITLRHLLATGGAFFADVGAQIAVLGMKFTHAEHEIGAIQAGLGAVGKNALVVWRSMIAAEPEAVGAGFSADHVTFEAGLDAVLKLGIHCVGMLHALLGAIESPCNGDGG
jgi:hypothetical protein